MFNHFPDSSELVLCLYIKWRPVALPWSESPSRSASKSQISELLRAVRPLLPSVGITRFTWVWRFFSFRDVFTTRDKRWMSHACCVCVWGPHAPGARFTHTVTCLLPSRQRMYMFQCTFPFFFSPSAVLNSFCTACIRVCIKCWERKEKKTTETK